MAWSKRNASVAQAVAKSKINTRRGFYNKTKFHKPKKTFVYGDKAAKRSDSPINRPHGRAPYGTHYINFVQHAKLTVAKPSGRRKHFQKRISPGTARSRTSWKKARSYSFRKELKPRKPRKQRLPHFSNRHKRITPY